MPTTLHVTHSRVLFRASSLGYSLEQWRVHLVCFMLKYKCLWSQLESAMALWICMRTAHPYNVPSQRHSVFVGRMLDLTGQSSAGTLCSKRHIPPILQS